MNGLVLRRWAHGGYGGSRIATVHHCVRPNGKLKRRTSRSTCRMRKVDSTTHVAAFAIQPSPQRLFTRHIALFRSYKTFLGLRYDKYFPHFKFVVWKSASRRKGSSLVTCNLFVLAMEAKVQHCIRRLGDAGATWFTQTSPATEHAMLAFQTCLARVQR